MSTASTVATLYGGFGIVTVTKIFSESLQINPPIIALLFGVSSLILSIFLAALASFVKVYSYPFNSENFVKKDESTNKYVFNTDKIHENSQLPTSKYSQIMIRVYTLCVAENFKTNNTKASYLQSSQIVFFIGIVTVPIFIYLSVIQ